MDPAHLHLIITHLPVFGCFLGMVVLAYGLFTKSKATIDAAYLVFILSSIGGGIAYLTGESAEQVVEHVLGIAERNIEAHEESAELTIIALAILGIACSITLVFSYKLKNYHNELAILILLIAIVCFGLAARTAYLGGKIRHSEIGSDPHQLNPNISYLRLTHDRFTSLNLIVCDKQWQVQSNH